jgi:hypothetical protein
MAVIGCVCPARPDGQVRHPDGDTVRLAARLGFLDVMAARSSIVAAQREDPEAGAGVFLAVMAEALVVAGIESWTLVDAKGKAVPVTRAAVRSFLDDHIEEGMVIADEAFEAYYEKYLAPLVEGASTSSPPTPTDESTSPTSTASPKPRKRSKPSSITTSPMDVTETMAASHGGGYSS